MDEIDEPTPAEKIAIRARQTGPQGELEPQRMRMVSFRVPVDLLASVSAFSSITAQSRNTTMIQLLEAGVHAALVELDDSEQYFNARDVFLDQSTQGE
jgi:hypothetical protein